MKTNEQPCGLPIISHNGIGKQISNQKGAES